MFEVQCDCSSAAFECLAPLILRALRTAEPPLPNPIPMAAAPPPPPQLDPEWKAVWSKEHGQYYFYNKKTKETSWTAPGAEDADDDDASVASEGAPETGNGLEEQKNGAKRKADQAGDSRGAETGPDDVENSSRDAKRARSAAGSTLDSRRPQNPAPTDASYAQFYQQLQRKQASELSFVASDPSTGTTRYAPAPPPEIDADTSALDALFAKIDETKEVLDKIAPPIERDPARAVDDSELRDDSPYEPAFAAPTVQEEEDLPLEFQNSTGSLRPNSSLFFSDEISSADYTAVGYFDSRTGKFRRPEGDARVADPRAHFSDASKSARQMNFYFDYEAFADQRAQERAEAAANPQPKKITKKQIEEWKQKKEQKKRKRLLAEYGKEEDDSF